jgi:hypothetical protein
MLASIVWNIFTFQKVAKAIHRQSKMINELFNLLDISKLVKIFALNQRVRRSGPCGDTENQALRSAPRPGAFSFDSCFDTCF